MNTEQVNETFADGFLFGICTALIVEALGGGIMYGCWLLAKWWLR